MRQLKTFTATALCTLALAMPTQALAWGEPGHQLIGSIAEQILTQNNPNTEAQVKQLLGGYTLAVAATWADCVRDVRKEGSGFKYVPGKETPEICKKFQTPDAEARMVDYASRNWDQCVYTAEEGCHAAYHFSDIAIQRGSYNDSDVGAHPWDIEHAIAAALAVLQGQPCPQPFSIKDKTEALLMLAHFVGDLHQPLHVGAIYLDPTSAAEVDPDKAADKGKSSFTEGANLIMVGSANLHHDWDSIPGTWGQNGGDGVYTADSTLVTAAEAVTASKGSASDWPITWANDSIKRAKSVFKGLTFAADGKDKWSATVPTSYTATRAKLQKKQIEKAGERLALLLAAALPGN